MTETGTLAVSRKPSASLAGSYAFDSYASWMNGRNPYAWFRLAEQEAFDTANLDTDLAHESAKAFDASGNGHHGYYVFGQYQFKGDSPKSAIYGSTNDRSLNPDFAYLYWKANTWCDRQTFSAGGWVNIENLGTLIGADHHYVALLDSSSSGTTSYTLHVRDTGAQFEILGGARYAGTTSLGASIQAFVPYADMPDIPWVFVTMTISSGTLWVQMNGVNLASTAITSTLKTPVSTGGDLRTGAGTVDSELLCDEMFLAPVLSNSELYSLYAIGARGYFDGLGAKAPQARAAFAGYYSPHGGLDAGTARAKGVFAGNYLPGPGTYGYTVNSLNPTAYWRLGDGGGSTLFDSTNHGHEAIASNIDLGRPGLLGGDEDTAGAFVAGSAGIINPASWPDSTNTFSLMGWVQAGEGASGTHVIARRDSSGAGLWRLQVVSGNLQFQKLNTSAATATTTGLSLYSGTHQVAVTYDGANIRLYTDGALRKTQAATGNLADSAQSLKLGDGWVGILDEFAYFSSHVLTAAEIQNAYAVGMSGRLASLTPRLDARLTGFYSLPPNDDSGAFAIAASPRLALAGYARPPLIPVVPTIAADVEDRMQTSYSV